MLTASTIKRSFASAAFAVALVAGTAAPAFAANATIQCENMNTSGAYAGKYVRSGQFNGATLCADNDTLSFNQNFTNNTHDFKLRGCSTTQAMGHVDMYIGGELMGSFYYEGTGVWEAPLVNVVRTQHKTGNQEVKLVCQGDNGSWDLELDYLVIENGRNQGNNGQQNQNWNNGQQNQNQQQNNNGATRTVQCEDMNFNGQHAHRINQPLNGAALCADNDTVSFWNNFTNDTHDITIKGQSNNDNCCKVDLYIGNQYVTSFFWAGTNNTECTIKGLHHLTGNQEVKLVCQGDNGSWDAYVDYIRIENGRNEGMTGGNKNNQVLYNGQPVNNNQGQQNQNWNNNQGQQNQNKNNGQQNAQPQQQNNNGQKQNNNQQPVSNGNVIQCEEMKVEGEYAAQTSPDAYWEPASFKGVKLCAPGDSVSFMYDFANNANDFVLTGQSSNDARAEVALYIDDEYMGSFFFDGQKVVDAKLENIAKTTHKTGKQKVTLTPMRETGLWDVNVDKLTISNGRNENANNGQAQQNNNGQQNQKQNVQPQQQNNNGQKQNNNGQAQQNNNGQKKNDNGQKKNDVKLEQNNNNGQTQQNNNGQAQQGDGGYVSPFASLDLEN